MITLTSPLPVKMYTVINVHLQHCIFRKILCPKPLRLLLSFDVQSYFAAVLLSFLNIFFIPVFSELSLVANTHSGRELITAWGLTSETHHMCWESPCPSAKAWSQQRTMPCPQTTLDVKEPQLWRILIIVSVYPWRNLFSGAMAILSAVMKLLILKKDSFSH